MNKKKGFILMYSVIMMTFVTLLIGAITVLVNASSVNNVKLEKQFNERARIDQIGEYFAHNVKDYYVYSIAAEEGFYADVEDVMDGKVDATLTLYKGNTVVLYVEVFEGNVIKWLYGGSV